MSIHDDFHIGKAMADSEEKLQGKDVPVGALRPW